MWFLKVLRGLPIFLIIVSGTLASAALPVEKSELTPETFKDSVAKGLWFIEHFSPYCGHCRNFAATWEKLVEETAKDMPFVRLAQVNCAVHGDLCNENGILSYPSLTMYRDGQVAEQFQGNRDPELLTAFIKRHVESMKPPAESKAETVVLNPSGDVLNLSPEIFSTMLSHGPMFVKFFAPWCGHCKKLAPTWKQLARHMQNRLTIAEIDCDDHASLCKTHEVQGYPTLIYLTAEGLKSEYNGGRKIDQLKAFAEKASAAGLQAITAEELHSRVAESDVVYLLLHSSSNDEILETIRRAAAPLLGSPTVYTSSSSDLRNRFSVLEGTWALVALKDHDAYIPSSVLQGAPYQASEEMIKSWLLSHRLPTTLELTQDTFQSVMNAPQAPLVVLAAVTNENKVKVKDRFRDIGKKWRLRTRGTGVVNGREVVFTWMDVERWADWMKSMYGVKKSEQSDLEDISIVITDHQRLIFYDTDLAGSPIKLMSSPSLFSAVEQAAFGKLTYKHSENLVERMARYLNNKMTAIEVYVVKYPIRTVFIILVGVILVFMGLRWLVRDDIPIERDSKTTKAGRLD